MNKKGNEDITEFGFKKIIIYALSIMLFILLTYILVVKLIGGILNP